MAQIKRDGAQPEELARTRSLFYSFFNLEAMFQLARLAEHSGVDLWDVGDERIRKALDYVVPYSNPRKPWPLPETVTASRARMLQVLVYASYVYEDEYYREKTARLPIDANHQLEQLVVPLMR